MVSESALPQVKGTVESNTFTYAVFPSQTGVTVVDSPAYAE